MQLNDTTYISSNSKFFSKIVLCLGIFIMLTSFSAFSKPKTKVFYSYTVDGFAQVQIQNMISKELACWIAIDGHKIKFRLPPATTSRWIKASDKRFDYTSFNTWCDYIELYPQYKKYSVGGSILG